MLLPGLREKSYRKKRLCLTSSAGLRARGAPVADGRLVVEVEFRLAWLQSLKCGKLVGSSSPGTCWIASCPAAPWHAAHSASYTARPPSACLKSEVSPAANTPQASVTAGTAQH